MADITRRKQGNGQSRSPSRQIHHTQALPTDNPPESRILRRNYPPAAKIPLSSAGIPTASHRNHLGHRRNYPVHALRREIIVRRYAGLSPYRLICGFRGQTYKRTNNKKTGRLRPVFLIIT